VDVPVSVWTLPGFGWLFPEYPDLPIINGLDPPWSEADRANGNNSTNAMRNNFLAITKLTNPIMADP